MKSLSNVLRDIEDIHSEQELTDRQGKDLRGILQECHNVPNDVGRVLSKYYDLDSSPKKLTLAISREECGRDWNGSRMTYKTFVHASHQTLLS
jgi:hypothetical protein